MPAKIHPTAIIDPGAKIADGAEIAPYAIIGPDVQIGEGTKVGPFCVLENCTIGKNNEFIASSFIGVKPQDLSYKDEHTRVEIGDGNKIRECVTIHRSTDVNVPTRVGNNCLLMANAHVAHDCQLGNRIILVNSCGVAGHVVIHDGAILSGLSALHQFVRVGSLAMLSGGGMLTQDLPPFCIAEGNRAKLIGLNIVGLRRAGFSASQVKAIKDTYKILFLSNLNMSDAVKKAKEQKDITKEASYMIQFCEESKRGVITARLKLKKDGPDGDDE